VIPLSGVIDIEGYKNKINEKIKKAESEAKTKRQMLSNKNFNQRAPKEIVSAEKEKLNLLNEEVQKLRGLRDGLKT
ncbi:MAG: hypothetical protein FJZ12_03045, partial [Candidatus Omnitrophica bacterium]|nr:hypothetical protein [Candidatus Omnitrophota bacterium]